MVSLARVQLGRRSFVVVVPGVLSSAREGRAQGAFQRRQVVPGVTISVPHNWRVGDADDRTDLEAHAESLAPRAGVRAEGSISFVAARESSDGIKLAWMSIRVAPAPSGEPALGDWPQSAIAGTPPTLNRQMAQALHATGSTVLREPATYLRRSGTSPYFLTEAAVRDPNFQDTAILMVGYFGRVSGRPFRVSATANYLSSVAVPFRAICESILDSVAFA